MIIWFATMKYIQKTIHVSNENKEKIKIDKMFQTFPPNA